VIVNALAANDGVMPFDTASEEVSAPENNRIPAPLLFAPIPKCVTVEVPPVHAGNEIVAALTALFPETVQPVPERATATRAYEVYALSLVVCDPDSPGSAVCSEMYRFPAVEDPTSPVASPTPANVVFLKIRFRRPVSRESEALIVCYPLVMFGVTVMMPSRILNVLFELSVISTSYLYRPGIRFAVCALGIDRVTTPEESSPTVKLTELEDE
jgi:hypothetical protein